MPLQLRVQKWEWRLLLRNSRNVFLISLCTVITLFNNQTNLYMKKCFFQQPFCIFEKLFYCYECRNISKNTCAFMFRNRSSHQGCSIKAVLENIAIFPRKYLCWSLFLVKLQAFRVASLLKRGSNTGVFLWI